MNNAKGELETVKNLDYYEHFVNGDLSEAQKGLIAFINEKYGLNLVVWFEVVKIWTLKYVFEIFDLLSCMKMFSFKINVLCRWRFEKFFIFFVHCDRKSLFYQQSHNLLNREIIQWIFFKGQHL